MTRGIHGWQELVTRAQEPQPAEDPTKPDDEEEDDEEKDQPEKEEAVLV